MNLNKNIVVFSAGCLFLFSHPLYVSADRCDDAMDEASRIFNAAMTASKRKKHAEAVQLYKKAEKYYKKASKMKKCG